MDKIDKEFAEDNPDVFDDSLEPTDTTGTTYTTGDDLKTTTIEDLKVTTIDDLKMTSITGLNTEDEAKELAEELTGI